LPSRHECGFERRNAPDIVVSAAQAPSLPASEEFLGG